MMVEIVYENIFEIMIMLNNLVLVCRFYDHHNLVFTLYNLWNVCFLLRYGSWKFQLELWNMNHKSLNRTLTEVIQTIFISNWEGRITLQNKKCNGADLYVNVFLLSQKDNNSLIRYIALKFQADFAGHMIEKALRFYRPKMQF